MRDQILSGIRSAMAARHTTVGTVLPALGEADQSLLVEHILSALGVEPEGTPAPEPVVVPAATVAFTVSPAAIVARMARAAQAVAERHASLSDDPGSLFSVESYFAFDDATESREFLFSVQHLFGCKVRCIVDAEHGRKFLISGHRDQQAALLEALDTFREYAASTLADLDASQRRQFWATLGAMIAAAPESVVLAEANAETYAAARRLMVDAHGPARTLRRTAPATEGAVYDLAASAMSAGSTEA